MHRVQTYTRKKNARRAARRVGLDPDTHVHGVGNTFCVKLPIKVKQRTHCKRGHELIEVNRVWSDGGLKCRLCRNFRDRLRYHKLKAEYAQRGY